MLTNFGPNLLARLSSSAGVAKSFSREAIIDGRVNEEVDFEAKAKADPDVDVASG